MNLPSELVWWLAIGSGVTFVGSLLAVPAIIIRLPQDYFTHRSRHRVVPPGIGLVFYVGWLVAKNLAGVVFVGMGVAMLVLPGQGILSILLGLSLINFPGKYRLEQFLVSRKPVRRSIQWIRRKAGVPPLKILRRNEATANCPPDLSASSSGLPD